MIETPIYTELYDISLTHDKEVGYFCSESNSTLIAGYNNLLFPFCNLGGWFNFKSSFKKHVGTTALAVNLTKDGA